MPTAAVEVSGQELLDIANASWSEKKQRYRGFQWLVARGQAIRQIEKVKGGRKDRREEGEHNLTVLFNHARNQPVSRIDVVAREAANPANAEGFAAANSELMKFAGEVVGLINGPLTGGFGIIDPTMIIALIQAIIQAVQACKRPPVPVPVTT